MGSQPEAEGLNLLPWPETVDQGAGSIVLRGARLSAEFDAIRSRRLERACLRLSEDIAGLTGLAADATVTTSIRIHCEQAGGKYPTLSEDESYWLVVDDAGIFLDAASEWGVLRGLTTLGQLVSTDGRIPHVAIDDRPRFCWRGLLLDPARHFLPIVALERTLDGMAQCKLNVLHLHLSDDQGFRFRVPEYPKLASSESYSSAELAGLVEFAADRGIRIVPELDMPGHVTSWLTAYPEWGARQVAASDRFGVHGACLDPANEAVYVAIEKILTALAQVFPDPCLHIGGDEVSPGWWQQDAAIAELMKREKLADVRAVQAYFNGRVGRLVNKLNRRSVAWDEVLNGELPDDWIVQAWRGATARDRALTRGHAVVVSAPYYLDLNYPVDVHVGFDPAGTQLELLAREDALLHDPRFSHVADGMRWTEQWREGACEGVYPESSARVLGAEACLWGELVDDAVLDVRLWSRLPALAERFWSAACGQDPADLQRRVDGFLDVQLPLRGRDLSVWSTAQLAGLGIQGDWLQLAMMLEPVKWYGRLLGAEALAARIEGREMPQSRPYGVDSALTGLADFLAPESRLARQVAALCEEAESGHEVATERLLRLTGRWQDLADQVDQLEDALVFLAEPARRLAQLGTALRARLERGHTLTVAELAALTLPMSAPMDEVMLAMPPPLYQWLLDPSAGTGG